MIVVVGLSHRTAPVDVRERFAQSTDLLEALLDRLAGRDEIAEAVFLSTCNRVEVLASAGTDARDAASPDVVLRAIRQELADLSGLDTVELGRHVYEHVSNDAIRHIFRVTASLDSMVLGEPQILGQVKSATDAAQAAGTLGGVLGRCLERAFAASKRVRTETSIGSGLVSISSVAVDLARRVFGDLDGATVLLVGAGGMAEAAARSLGRRARHLRVCNRSQDRADALAAAMDAEAVPWADLEVELAAADVVIVSTSSRDYVVTERMARRAMKLRRGRAMFVVDISVPRNVDPVVHDIDNIYVFNVDDLEEQVAEGLAMRQSELDAADQIVLAEVESFERWLATRHVNPTIVALRRRTKRLLMAELERSLSGKLKHLGQEERDALAQMLESASKKLLHAPTERLRSMSAGAHGMDVARALGELFELAEETEAGDGPASLRPESVPPRERRKKKVG